jgi:RNA polymerase sigma-70 factor (ECF subfamily)
MHSPPIATLPLSHRARFVAERGACTTGRTLPPIAAQGARRVDNPEQTSESEAGHPLQQRNRTRTRGGPQGADRLVTTNVPTDAPNATSVRAAQQSERSSAAPVPGPEAESADGTALPPELLEAVRRFQAEHREADFAVVYGHFARRVLGYFRGKGVTAAACADLSQEVWLRIATSLAGFRWEAPLGAWIFAIAYHVYLQHVTNEKPRRAEDELDPDALADDDDVLRRLIDADTRKRMHVAIEAMPLQMRTCMQLRYVQDLSYKDIAQVLQVAIETVAAHIHQGKDRLIRHLRPAASMTDGEMQRG